MNHAFISVLGTGRRIETMEAEHLLHPLLQREARTEAAFEGCLDAPEYMPSGTTEPLQRGWHESTYVAGATYRDPSNHR